MPNKYSGKYFLFLVAPLLFFFYLNQSFSQSQPYPFKQFPLPQDLPPIALLFEDHSGFIWLGTNEGLYRYDGLNYNYYSGKVGTISLGRESITCIFEDKENNLWIGARSGLYRLSPQRKDFDRYSFGEELYPRYMHQESDSSFLVHCSKGLFLFYPTANRWEKLETGIADKKILVTIRGKNNDLWIGTDNVVRKYDLLEKSFRDFKLPAPSFANQYEKISAYYFFLDSHDQLWINTWFKGVVKLDTRTGKTTSFDDRRTNKDSYLLDIYNPSMTEDADGNVWIASEISGINIYHSADGIITHIPSGTNDISGLIGNYFFIMSDREKNIWVKSDRAIHYLAWQSPIPELLSDASVFIEEPLFLTWMSPTYVLTGTYFGLYGINLETKKVVKLNSTIGLPSIHNADFETTADAMLAKDGTIWVCSPQGLRLLQSAKGKNSDFTFRLIVLSPSSSSFFPVRLFQFNDSIILVKGRTNTNVFATFNTRNHEYDYHTFPDTMSINQMALYKKDTIIIGIRNKGLYYYNVRDRSMNLIPWKFQNNSLFVRDPVFLNIVPLQNGSYGICTENYGLFIFNPSDNSFQHIDVASVSNTNRVFSVEEDQQHQLWIQTANQILCYNSENNSISKINLSNSFKGHNPFYFMHDGREVYSIFEGKLNRLNLRQLFFKKNPPRFYLQVIKARDKQLDWYNKDKIKLGYSDNFLSFDFIGIDYANPHGIYYSYKIPEVSDTWQNLGNRTSVSFGSLPAGKYHFMVKSTNDAGIESEVIQAPEIVITPPVWKSWWFMLVLLTLIAGTIFIFLRLRRNKREAELSLRNQIARDLHDDIGSTLSGIKIFSSIASGMAENNNDLSSVLAQIQDKSDIMMQSMSDIVWSINPTHDSLQDMIIRLKQYMSEVLESQNIEVEFSTAIDLKNHKIDLKYRKELYLALKEIINNAARHSRCKKLVFSITRQKGEMVFDIKDDGVGMNEKNIVRGNGLKNIQARIDQIGGKLACESSPGRGTAYQIRISLP